MNRSLPALAACLSLLLLCPGAHAAPKGYPSVVDLPSLAGAGDGAHAETFGQWEFTLRDKTEIIRGRAWESYVPFAKPYADEKAALPALVAELQHAGWEAVLVDVPRNPPLATLKLSKDGKEYWLHVEPTASEVHLALIERGGPTGKLVLPAPTEGIGKVPEGADFPFLKRFPETRLTQASRDDRPFLVQVEADKEPVQVATGSVRKDYQGKQDTGRLDVIVSYRDALKAAGWKIVEENIAITTGDPNLTAHFTRGTLDLWAHVHASGAEYWLAVADAGADRAPARLKAEIDRSCKVAIYGLNFDFGKATLREDSAPALEGIRQLLVAYPDLKVELGGHTDNVGKRDYNTRLSESRVNTVKGWLVARSVDAARLTTRGYADTQPVGDNEAPEGRARNRRVELRRADCSR